MRPVLQRPTSPTANFLRTIMAGASGLFLLICAAPVAAQSPYQTSADFEKYARMLREKALLKLQPGIVIPTANRPLDRPRYPWKNNIVTTLIWIGSEGKNSASAWDANWARSYGGVDAPVPAARRGFVPAGFVPRQNPFYCALPYNDVGRHGTKPEARAVIPWFKEVFEKNGQSVCRDRWVRIRSREGKDCYAQWSDCGPFHADHWQYVFGDERPKPNANKGAGISIAPAVRDYLGLGSTDVVDWQFIDFKDVPHGPWSIYGDNNNFVQVARRAPTRVMKPETSETHLPGPNEPGVFIRLLPDGPEPEKPAVVPEDAR